MNMAKDTNPLRELSMRVQFADGRYFNIYSKQANVKGWRKLFGWWFVATGLNIMFGRKSEWKLYSDSDRKKGD